MRYIFVLFTSKKHPDYSSFGKISISNALVALLFMFSLFVLNSEAQVCCPDFKLKDAKEICPPEGACQGSSPVGGQSRGIAACKLTPHTYTVYANSPGYIYTWTITGGSPAAFTGNPITVVWGTGSSGSIKVVISNLSSGGTCIDSIKQDICLIDGPQSNFIIKKDTVCLNTPVLFTNTSIGGSDYYWDFGDGTWSTLATPPGHVYAAPGVYTVTLTASNPGAQSAQGDIKRPCGCNNSISKTVVVLSSTGPVISLDCCFGTVCPGDTSSLCTPAMCSTYIWSVTGGTIISGAGTSCIKVKWNPTYTVPTTVSLSVPGCATTPCPGTTTLNVPVLYPNLPINGPTTLCVGSAGSYFLPSMPGTYYLWTTTAAAGTFAFHDRNRNTANVSISFTVAGTYQVQCLYNNPLAGCSGTSTFTVNVLPVFTFNGNETVCEGSTATYFANGTANWVVTPAGATVPAGSGSSKSITWNIPGTYTILTTPTATGSFCNPNAVKVVEVVAKPVLGNITGPVIVCPGKNFTYKITSNLAGSDFIWTFTAGSGIIMTQMGADKDSVIVKLNSPGPWTISVFQQVEISPGVFCPSATKTLTVNPFPAPVVTGPANVCVDAIGVFTASGPLPPGGIQWSVLPANRGTIILGQGTNSVNIRWHGAPITATVMATHCGGSGSTVVNIVNPPVITAISANGPFEYCLPAMPNNLTLSTTSGFSSYQWYVNNAPIGGATSSSYLIPNATFTGAGVYYFTVEVSNGLCTVTKTTYILIGNCAGGPPPNPVICSVDFSINPNPACVDQPVTFTAIPTGPGFTYQWSFGDLATSFQTPTQHAYASAGTYTVTLTATIGSCVAVNTKTVTVNPSPVCTISASDTIFCPGASVTLFGCPGFSSYQWFREGVLIGGATSATYIANKHGEYELVVTNGFGCPGRSNAIYIYMNGIPRAKITGDGSACAFASSLASFQLSAFYNSNYKYDWSSNPPGATFTPNNSNSSSFTSVSLTLPAILPYTGSFIVKVTDTVTGCIAYDTICVTFYQVPSVTVPFYFGCEGGPVTLTPSPIDLTKFNYQWSSGQTTPTITVSASGFYSLVVTDKATGCSTTVNAAMIYPRPDMSLFPHGCSTIKCKTDTLHLYMPLPLNATGSLSTYAGAYPSITWYDNGNYGSPIGSGKDLFYVLNTSGTHQISVVVKNNYNCSDTAGVYCLTVKCDTLDFGDAPDNKATGLNYPTLMANNGARHVIVPGVFMGSLADPEADGQPSVGANCDDNDCVYPSLGDDEDGVTMPAVIMQGGTVAVNVQASVNGFLDTWIDYNVDGDWADPGEHIYTTLALTAGSNPLSFTVPATAVMGQSYARFRFRTSQLPISYSGLVNDGEVEDYPVFIEECSQGDQLDFGDAPDNQASGFNYPTLLSGNGARHVMYSNIRMGALIDAESNGQPNIAASGDDIMTSDDEDGVQFMSKMYVGLQANIQVTASITGFLNAWMDFNKDGDWADPGEQIFTNYPLAAGVNNLVFLLPLTAQQGKTYARFRFNTIGGLTYFGLAMNGEVEDYRVHACPHWSPVHTSIKHLMVIPHTLPDMTAGDVLGVFYQDAAGGQHCGGLSEFNGSYDQLMMVYGDDPATPEKDGFTVGEPIIWKLCSFVKGDANQVDVMYDPGYPNHNGVFVINGLSALMGVIGLHVNAAAVPGTVCIGSPVQLHANILEPTTGVSFSWSSVPAGFSSGSQNPVVEPTVNTIYSVDAFDGLFHAFASAAVNVIEANPLADTSMVRNRTIFGGQSYCFNALSTITVAGNGSIFTVMEGGHVDIISGQIIRLLPGTRGYTGSYLHAYITTTGTYCCSLQPLPTSQMAGGMSDTLFKEFDKPATFVRVFPNPTTGTFTLEMTGVDMTSGVTIEIYGMHGELIEKSDVPAFKQRLFDLSSRAPGIYLVRVMKGSETAMIKVIRQ